MSTKTLTDQAIFDIIVFHLRQQGEKSGEIVTPETPLDKLQMLKVGDFRCLYRDPVGRKCAAGILIPDEEYSPSWENKRIPGISWFRENFTVTQFEMIGYLQETHDNYAIEDWEHRFSLIANALNLSYAPPSV